ncbi:MAG: hypothetical protein K9H41_01230 [Bacteroidia bacterium]|nr:hypothetical protein [Bacteroidia bacterium]
MKTKLFKIVISLVAITYVFSTIGVSVISHYCGGELEEVALFSKPTSCCGEDESEMEDGCCKNEIVHVFFKEDFTFQTLISDSKPPISQLFILIGNSIFFSEQIVSKTICLINKKTHPPNLVQQDIVITSVLLI